jgi:hypothetical protein
MGVFIYLHSKSLLLKRKAVSGVTLLVTNFVLRQNIKLPTNATNKLKNYSITRFYPKPYDLILILRMSQKEINIPPYFLAKPCYKWPTNMPYLLSQ